MNHFLPSTPAPSPPFALDGSELPSLVSPSTSSNSSWSIETDPQLFTPDATFWHDMSSYICASPKSHYDYNPSDPSASPSDEIFKVTARGSRRVRSKEQSPEVILRRRAQNRASQRAYRDRKDRRVKELEAQLEEMSGTNESLQRNNTDLSALVQELKDESAKLKAQTAANATASSVNAAAKTANGEDEEGNSQWRTETCLSSLAGLGLQAQEGEAGKGIVVKVMICKRCFGATAESTPGDAAAARSVCEN